MNFVTGGTININATYNGVPWAGPVSWSITGNTVIGVRTFFGDSVPEIHTEQPTGFYVLTYHSGGPDGQFWTMLEPP